jgi:ribonuclease HI
MVYENALNIYADGSSYSHPRRGGIGIRYVTIDGAGNEVVQNEDTLGHEGATNNEMELLACIKALEGASEHPSFGAVNRIYVLELWKRLIRVLRKIPKRVDFEWVKGHAKDTHNKAVDKLAKQSAKGVLNRPSLATDKSRVVL